MKLNSLLKLLHKITRIVHYRTCKAMSNCVAKRLPRVKAVMVGIVLLSAVGIFLDINNLFSISNEQCLRGNDEDRMRVNRDLLSEIQEGPLRNFKVQPGDLPNIVHYVWCGNKKFLFGDYLGFLSFARIIRPVKIIFHYNELPKLSDYHTWFQELIQSLPQVVLRKTDKQLRCDTVDSLNFGLEQLAASHGGGMYFGERAALTYIPSNWKTKDYFSYTVPGSTSGEQIIIYTKVGLVDKNETLHGFKSRILSKVGVCVDEDLFNKEMKAYNDVRKSSFPDGIVSPCVVLPKEMYPKNIINVDTAFAANFRRIFYGKSELLVSKPSQEVKDLIPLISHYILFVKDIKQRPKITFSHYMSVLSALYVAGFERVYIHGDQVPTGRWWDRLQSENVTFVFIEQVETVYQQKVDVLAHVSDILRPIILSKYGGVYQDNDVIWGNPVTEEIRKYPSVYSYDWAHIGDWPGALNNGVIMSKAKSLFLRKFLETYWLNKDYIWIYNGVLMPYKVYEMNPKSLYVYERLQWALFLVKKGCALKVHFSTFRDVAKGEFLAVPRRGHAGKTVICFGQTDPLQVMCTFDVCHPTWHPDYHRPYNDMMKPTGNFSLDEVLGKSGNIPIHIKPTSTYNDTVLSHFPLPSTKVAADIVRQTKALSVRNNLGLLNAVRYGSLFKVEKTEASIKCLGGKDEDRMRVNRDILNHIPEGPLKSFNVQPGDIPNTVHYVWCGDKKFLFEDYLGFLSFIRIIRPLKIIFHYNEIPKGSDYHTWFQELIQSLPHVVLRKTDKRLKCDTVDSLIFGLEQLAASPNGGIYVGSRIALTYIPLNWKTDDYFSYTVPGSSTGEQIILYTKFGLVDRNETFEAFKYRLLSKVGVCVDAEQFNKEMKAYDDVKKSGFPGRDVSPCVVLPKGMYPKDIINVDTPFASNFRKIFYGKPELLLAKPSQDPNDLMPLISHYISLANKPNQRPEWTFPQYISVLSALYVAGFERVYIHGDQVPTGQWWDRLQAENVTFVYVESVETVYQQKVDVPAHKSDIIRLFILLEYGGVYQDRDVIWGNPITEEIRKYKTVFSYDWAKIGDWPTGNNNGVIMSKAKSPFLQKCLEAFWLEKDNFWEYNGVLMPYKVYEMNPEMVYLYEKLQILCHVGICHPTWHPDYVRPVTDMRPTGSFSLDEVLAYHFTWPKPDPSLISLDTIKKGTNVAAQIGQRVLKAVEKSGRMNLLAK